MSKTSLIIMDRGQQYFCHDEMDQNTLGSNFIIFEVLDN
jgi:hypothetical protein